MEVKRKIQPDGGKRSLPNGPRARARGVDVNRDLTFGEQST